MLFLNSIIFRLLYKKCTLGWKKIASGTVHKDENAVAIMATIASEMKKKEERVNNIVASIPKSKFNCISCSTASKTQSILQCCCDGRF